MKYQGPEKGTESFYKIERVAEEYEAIRFEHPGGKLLDSVQKRAVLEGVNSFNLSGKKVLDVACGTGRFSRLFRSMGSNVVGLDLSRAMLNRSRDRQSAEAYVEASALHLPFKDSAFDMAISVNAFNHLPAFEKAINEICRVSQRVVLGLPHKHSVLLLNTLYRVLRGWGYQYTRHKTARYKGAPLVYTRYFSEKELEAFFKKNRFKVIRCPKCWVFPFPRVPEIFIKMVQDLENIAVRSLGRFGTFMAIVAERK
jgi:ubiquinone/menaquinone biosynthesis C-methylase UbiE